MKYGWLQVSIADIWDKPKYNSERVNQLLFSDLFKIKDERKGFYHIEKYDSYQGWVDKRYITLCTHKVFKNYQQLKKHTVKSDKIHTLSTTITETNPNLLFYGTKIAISKKSNKIAHIILPDNSKLTIPSSAISANLKKQNILPIVLIKEAKRFLGLPYLWGGITTTGFDCSGFTQTILSRFGIDIPRDTKDQIKVGKEIKRDSIQTGDLLFFYRHVGFAIGKNKIIHSSVGGGGVKINSLSKNDNDYRKDLDESFKTARRIL